MGRGVSHAWVVGVPHRAWVEPRATLGEGACGTLAATVMTGLSGCVAVGYTSGGGWFVWPGGLGLLLVVVLLVFLLRGRR